VPPEVANSLRILIGPAVQINSLSPLSVWLDMTSIRAKNEMLICKIKAFLNFVVQLKIPTLCGQQLQSLT